MNIKDDLIDTFDYQTVKGISHVFLCLKKVVKNCPHCKLPTQKTNGTQTVKIKHALLRDRYAIVHIKKFRYVCIHCNKTFMTTPGLTTERKTISLGISNQVMEMAKNPLITFKYMADELGISPSSAVNIFLNRVPQHRYTLPKVICIDEVYLGRKSRRKYGVILLDFKGGKALDFIFGRRVVDCTRELSKYSRKERYRVEYISTDMYSGFINMANTLFPKAKICIDSFHVISLIVSKFEEHIRRTMRLFDRDSKEYYLLKDKRFVLLKNENSIDWNQTSYSRKLGYHISNRKLKELIFDIDPALKTYYELKENYISFNRNKTIESNELDNLIEQFRESGIPSLRLISNTLIKHYEYILNSFTRIDGRRISNGPIEARNKTVKLLLRNASGYRNELLLMSRVMYVLNWKY